MFRSIAESLLGGWGSAMLNFILEHSLIFSSAVVIFGIAMIIRNRRIRAGEDEKKKQKENPDERA